VQSTTLTAGTAGTAADRVVTKPRLGLGAIGNLSFGFFGIQIAFALQTANVSRIFQTLGASIDALPILWIAGPMTGLLVQPIIGYLSDRTWGRFGRRRPYFLAGALLSATALVLLPNAPYLWLAVIAFWLLDISLNVSMEPFRAFVGDMLPDEQRTTGYAVQTIFIGFGALAASAAPWVFTNVLGMAGDAPAGVVPENVRVAFYVGAAALFVAVLWTVLSTREYSPAELARFASAAGGAPAVPVDSGARVHPVRELLADLFAMPAEMRRLAVIQFFSWCGFFVLWIYGTPVVAFHHFGGAAPGTAAYNTAGNHVGNLFAVYNGVAAVYAFLLAPLAARFGRERVHAANLVAGAAGFAGFCLTRDPVVLYAAMVGVGMAWASVLTMPYALLCGALPYRKLGVYMRIFNFFIVLPQLVVAGVMGTIVRVAFPGDPAGVMAIAATAHVVAAALAWRRVRA
jgi:maltose/moltooligosaccharide transporter